MSENIFQSWNENTQNILNPIHELNKAAINNLAKITEIQFSSAKYFTDLSLNQMRAAAGIENIEGAKSFTSKSIELAGEINKKILEDGKKIAELGSEFKSDVETIFSKANDAKPADKASKQAK